jgi:hypothetical protein
VTHPLLSLQPEFAIGGRQEPCMLSLFLTKFL